MVATANPAKKEKETCQQTATQPVPVSECVRVRACVLLFSVPFPPALSADNLGTTPPRVAQSPSPSPAVKIPVPTRNHHREGSYLGHSSSPASTSSQAAAASSSSSSRSSSIVGGEDYDTMNKRNKASRPGGPARTQRQRSIAADGIYNNSLFMHAATSHVGNIVQVQTASGVIFEGVFRTFSSQFQVVLEMAHRIEHGPDSENKIIVDTVVDRLIFKPSDIVSIAAKDVDLDYATRDTFKTDTAISSARCNGNGRPEERELEPWDESGGGGGLNGDGGLNEFSLELDANANGWDVNDMFHKNETIYGVQSTFDQSLTGYTVQITKKDSDDFKIQESEAERIANEIENNPIYKDRIDLENGDEEDAFAAVVRPGSNASPQPTGQGSSGMNDKSSVMPSNTKYIVPAKRKGHAGKLTARSTPPPLTNNGGPPPQQQQQQQQPPQQPQPQPLQQPIPQQQQPQSPQAPHKTQNSYQNMSMPPQQPQQQQQQQGPTSNQYAMHSNQYGGHVQHQPHQQQHSQAPVVNSNQNMNKMNGDGGRDSRDMSGSSSSSMNVNSNTKPLPQRTVRQYPSSAPNYAEPPPSLGPQQMGDGGRGGQMQSMGKPPMHVTHPHHATHMPPPPVVANDQQQQQQQPQVVMSTHHVGLPPPHINVAGQAAGGPPQQQQQQQMQQPPPPQPQRQVVGRRDMDDLRKFGQDFKLAPPQQQQQQPPMQNVHQQPPPQSQQQHVVQQQMQEQPPLESSPPIPQKHAEPPPHQQQQQQNQSSQTGLVHQQQQPTQHMVQSQQTQPPLQSQPLPQQQQQQPTTTSPPQVVPSAVVQHNSSNVSVMNSSVSSNTSSVAAGGGVIVTNPIQNAAPSVVDNGTGTGTSDGVVKAPPKKTFTLNPAAKPFTPRSPSTPNPSRHTSSSPHTPQTPGPVLVQQQQQQQPQPGAAYPGQQHVPQPQPILMSYVLQPPQSAFQATAQQHPHAGQQPRIRKAMSVVPPSQMAASQMAAAATGQPLLTPGPIQMFPPYPPTLHHQHFQAAPSFQPYRIYETPQPTQIQYLTAATPPSSTPSPGQPHQQYHPGPQPSPASAGPPTYAPAHQQQPPHYQMMCVAPQMVQAAYPNMTQAAPLQNHHQQNLHVMHVQQHPAQ